MSDAQVDVASELADTLDKTTIGEDVGSIDATTKSANDDVDEVDLAKWVAPKKYDYDSFSSKPDGAAGGDETGLSWASHARRYEWEGDYGEVPPSDPEVEKELFQTELAIREGENFSQLKMEVVQEAPVHVEPIHDFKDAGLHPVMQDTVTRLCKYEFPTPVQSYVIPAVLQGKEVIACAQTGSGKTAAYLIPILSNLMGKAKKLSAPRPRLSTYNEATDAVRAEPLVLIVAPSRELALQIFDEARKLCYRTMLRPCCVYGGAPSGAQRRDLAKGCDLLVATPGRLVDFMNQPRMITLNRLRYTVIDEADEMVQDDWSEALGRIMASGESNPNDDHSFLMFSATFPKGARALANEYMSEDRVRFSVGRAGSTHNFIQQRIVWTEDSAKQQALFDLLHALPPARTLVFVNTRKKADLVDDYLYNKGLPSTSIHSDRNQREREDALRSFRNAQTPIMVATGVSARGMDIAFVMHVINYDLPSAMHGGIDEYVHRIGRTARIGNRGMATSFYNDRNEDIAEDLAKILIESKQMVPDFLQDKVPEGPLIWDDEKDDNDADGGVATSTGDAGFGGGDAAEGWKPEGNAEEGASFDSQMGGAW